MNNFYLIEIVGVFIILFYQVKQFLSIKEKIETYKDSLPSINAINIIKCQLNPQLFLKDTDVVLSNIEKYQNESVPKILKKEVRDENGKILERELREQDNRVNLELVGIDNRFQTKESKKIINPINKYLFRNRGIAADFNLIKDIVERHFAALESEILNGISVPLYLGLLGTFLGIVVGLFQITVTNISSGSAIDTTVLDSAINSLLFGVMIAMVASATGLFLTMLNSGFNFKNSKVIVENKKNDFYSFIQIELLPVLNQSINSTFVSLQNNLFKFNDEFKTHITSLSTILGKNHDALVTQEAILNSLENIDINKFAKANISILQELQKSIGNLQQLGDYIESINDFIGASDDLTDKLKEVLHKTENFEKLGIDIHTTFQENKKLNEFLQSHYNELDKSHQMINNAMARVGLTFDESLEQLKYFSEEKIKDIHTITLKEVELMQERYPEKWKKLDHLVDLEKLVIESKKLNELVKIRASEAFNELKDLNINTKYLIEEITSNRLISVKKIKSAVKNYFRKQ